MRERWFGATGQRVPEIAVEGELELPDDVLWLETAGPDELRQAHAAGRPVAAHADTPEGVKEALAHPEVACVLVPPARRDLLELDLTRAHVRQHRRRDLLDRRVRPRRRPVGRGDAVEVPRRRLGRAVGRAARRRDRDAVVREPALRARRAGAAPRRACPPRRSSTRLTAADEGRAQRQVGVVDGAGRSGDVHRGGVPRRGPAAAPAPATQRRGTSSSRRRPSTRSPTRSRRQRGKPLADGCSTASPRRRPQAATGAASSPPRSSSSSRTAATRASPTSLVDLRVDDHERPIEELRRLYGIHTGALRRDAARRSGSRSTTRSRAELRERLAELGYDGRARAERFTDVGRERRTSRSASTASSGSTRSCWRQLREAR